MEKTISDKIRYQVLSKIYGVKLSQVSAVSKLLKLDIKKELLVTLETWESIICGSLFFRMKTKRHVLGTEQFHR